MSPDPLPIVYKGRTRRLGAKIYRIDDAYKEWRWIWNSYTEYEKDAPVIERRIGIGIRFGGRCLSIYWGRA